MLTKEAILKVKDRKVTRFHVEKWGGDVYLSTFSVSQYEDFVKLVDKQSSIADYLAIAIVDESGNRLFTSDEDIKMLADRDLDTANKIVGKWLELNSITKKSIENAEKN